MISQIAKNVKNMYSVDQKEARIMARNIVSVEVAIFMLRLLKPEENKIDAIPFLFYSLKQPSFLELSPTQKRYLANVHALLPNWKSKRFVSNQLREYSVHNRRRLGLHVKIDWETRTFSWHHLTHWGRENVYEQKLALSLPFRDQSPKFFYSYGGWGRYYDHHDSSYHYFSIPEEWCNQSSRSLSLNCDHVHNRSPIEIPINSLQKAAQEMDSQLEKSLLDSKQWEKRLQSIVIKDMKQYLVETQEIEIEGTQHWVGPLSVGKSSVMEILSYYMVKERGEKVTLIVPDIIEMFKLIDQFEHLGIHAVPIMSDRQRQNHIQQYLQSFSQDELQSEGFHLANRKSFRYLSVSCQLKTMEKDDLANVSIAPPCYRLQKAEKSDSTKEVKNYVCPFISSCDYHRMYQELDKADIYVTNINSLLAASLPSFLSKEKMLMLEYLLRRSSLILIDEADNVQSTCDKNFIMHEELKSDHGGWLDRLRSEVNTLLEKDPSIQWKDQEVQYWLTNVNQAQKIQTEIRFLLENDKTKKAIRSFIRKRSFTGLGLLAQLGLYLAGIPVEKGEDGIQDIDDQEMNKKKEIYDEIKNFFFQFYLAYREEESEKKLEERVKRLKDIVEIADRFHMAERVEAFLKEMVEDWKLHVHHWEEMIHRFLFILHICNLEKRLHILTSRYAHVAEVLEVEAVRDTAIFRGLSPEYQSFVPINPMGIQFGFRYDGGSEVENRGGALSVFRYIGVGRYLVHYFNQIFQYLDDQPGAHTVLLSATSFAPASTRYHIDLPVRYVICRKDNTQPSVKYVFRPGIVVSGKVGEKRKEALQQQVKQLIQDDYLLRELENAPPGRKRALIVSGSYDESKYCARFLKEHPLLTGKVYSLTKKLDPGAEDWQIERQKVTAFAEGDGNILFAPRAALERGLNILTPSSEGPVAAFSLLFYLIRPYPVPYELGDMANLLNDFAMRNYLNPDNQRVTLYEEMMNMKKQAYQMHKEFFRISHGYRQLGEQRNHILMDLNVSCSQLEGRLFRGSVPQPAKVIFLDASFSPYEAKGREGTLETSMLKGWKEVLSPTLPFPEMEKLIEILYGFRKQGMDQMETL